MGDLFTNMVVEKARNDLWISAGGVKNRLVCGFFQKKQK